MPPFQSNRSDEFGGGPLYRSKVTILPHYGLGGKKSGDESCVFVGTFDPQQKVGFLVPGHNLFTVRSVMLACLPLLQVYM